MFNLPKKQQGKNFTMKTSLDKMLRWFCRKMTSNEFASVVLIIHEILSGKRSDFEFKPEEPERTANYRKFAYDLLPPLTKPPETTAAEPSDNWRRLLAEHEERHGRKLNPVRRKEGGFEVPEHAHCEHCGAPSAYLYLNDGCKGNQIRCKVCDKLSATHRTRRESKAKYHCPYCGSALYHWKDLGTETIYKCPNDHCRHYQDSLARLTSEERRKRSANPYDPNYKLRYQYREYHIDPKSVACARPESATKVDLRRIRNSFHTAGLALALAINLALSSRMTKQALKGLFGIDLSHQSVINYMNASAAAVAPWLDRTMPKPTAPSAGDETYIIVESEWHYTWFVIDSETRAICGWNISSTRGAEPALATLFNTFGPPGSNPDVKYVFIRDGLGSYDAAVAAYNQMAGRTAIETKTVVGLEDNDPVSAEFRNFKQMIERLNRTYKFHARPRAGFKDFDGAVAMTALFVAYYNHLRPHMSLKNQVPMPLPGLDGVVSWPRQWELLLQLAAA